MMALPLLFGCNDLPSQGYSIENVSNSGGSAFYEIFVGTFADSNGDGVGDLNGITSKLDYLEDLGVSYLWLTPVHPSPSYHKYDVMDYYTIDQSFGTLDDFDNLVAKAKTHHIGIIMDMVFNHCSSQNPWFTEWCKEIHNGDKTGTYFNDFSWSRTALDGYSFSSAAGVYVESRFSESMPEFNLDSTHVQSELTKIQDFWLDRGVAGFRYDAVLYYYYGDATKNITFMKSLVATCKAKKADVYQVAEAWKMDSATIADYSSTGMRCFNFPTSENASSGTVGYVAFQSGLSGFRDAVVQTQASIMVEGGVEPCFFVSNHDQDRWGGYYNGRQNADYKRKLVASCYLLTPGTPFMYYGEEIAMRGIRGNESTDAARRQAMVWGNGETQCAEPQNFLYKDQVTVGAKEARADGWSLLNHVRKVLSIRNKYNDLFRSGIYEALDLNNESIGAFNIKYQGTTKLLIHYNGSSAITIPVTAKTMLEDIETSHVSSTYVDGKLTIQPFSSVLLDKGAD